MKIYSGVTRIWYVSTTCKVVDILLQNYYMKEMGKVWSFDTVSFNFQAIGRCPLLSVCPWASQIYCDCSYIVFLIITFWNLQNLQLGPMEKMLSFSLSFWSGAASRLVISTALLISIFIHACLSHYLLVFSHLSKNCQSKRLFQQENANKYDS